jgi:hypothetical protein
MNIPKICILQVPLSFHDIIVCINFTVGKAIEYILSIFFKIAEILHSLSLFAIFLRYTQVRVT